jgi:hypothetical protein
VLHALSGGADAFPNTSFYPKDFRPYPPSNIRIERTPKFKLSNLINMGRSGLGGGTRPIASAADFPLTSRRLLQGGILWPEDDLKPMASSMWAPWPGYYVSPTNWTLVVETDGPSAKAALRSGHLDRPILYMRGHNYTSCSTDDEAASTGLYSFRVHHLRLKSDDGRLERIKHSDLERMERRMKRSQRGGGHGGADSGAANQRRREPTEPRPAEGQPTAAAPALPSTRAAPAAMAAAAAASAAPRPTSWPSPQVGMGVRWAAEVPCAEMICTAPWPCLDELPGRLGAQA